MGMKARNLLDRLFSGVGVLAIVVMGLALVLILAPIFSRGAGAYIFKATVEHRRMLLERFERGNAEALAAEAEAVREARAPVYAMLARYAAEDLAGLSGREKREARQRLEEVEDILQELFGPMPGAATPVLPRQQYGATRWDRAEVKLDRLLYVETWDYSDSGSMGQQVLKPRREEFAGTALEPLFGYVETHLEAMLRPEWTFYWGFLTDSSFDAHIFGGIWPELVGTIYLTLGAMVFAVPLGIVSAIYFAEYAQEGRLVSLLRTCVSTLAGVPSIVFGLFGLAFFINTMHVSRSKSVLAGSLTLGMLILPTVIRAAEEAIRAVPHSYKEAAVGLGAGRWRTVVTVILPAALPGILTGTVISMGRAAGETAPIIFTAAVSVGKVLSPWETLTQPTPALSWNIYNLCTEHEAVDEIRHVQFGMAATLVLAVLLLNLVAIIMRARISNKLKG
ncbi:MAG: phosphate ABC transporter permease PstA [Phycisphaerae bacterium]|nr:phosphate ABC transporter permease PstA [Phycisphaerae bacterium]